MKIKIYFLLVGALFCNKLYAQQGFPFADEIKAFRHQDSLNFPKPGGILFIGGSSIRLWDDLEQRFAGKPIIKRGVGGSELNDLVKYYAPYILFPYKPRKIFIYAGENDIFGGKPVAAVLNEFEQLYGMIRKEFPRTEIYYLSIKLNPSRISSAPLFNQTNTAIRKYLAGKPGAQYIDVNTILFKPNSSYPDSAYFKPDMLHLNSKGYDRWQQALKPFVK